MTFVLLSRVLLWLLLGTIVYSLFQRFYPSSGYLGRVIAIFFLAVLALALFGTGDPAVGSILQVLTFPLQPLGAAILLLIFATQRMKGGGLDKPGGSFVGWALAILLIASTPAIAYFLYRAPIAFNLAPETLIAFSPQVESSIVSDVTSGITLNSLNTPYLLQTPEQIRARGGLTISDFVPNAQALRDTTVVWNSYLNQLFGFIRPRT
jgi:hypothetical protein